MGQVSLFEDDADQALIPSADIIGPFIPSAPLRALLGSEQIELAGDVMPGGTVLDFWRWAYGDLRGNTLRGDFAEWLVGLLLGVDLGNRPVWDSFDHSLVEARIEVKSCGYLQGWSQTAYSRITFGPLLKLTWDDKTGLFSPTAQLNADWYVFALQTCQNGPDYNPLDLAQWEFYLLPREQLTHLRKGQALSLAQVSKLTKAMTASELRTDGRQMIESDPSGKGVQT
jgi:hypothetical protein